MNPYITAALFAFIAFPFMSFGFAYSPDDSARNLARAMNEAGTYEELLKSFSFAMTAEEHQGTKELLVGSAEKDQSL